MIDRLQTWVKCSDVESDDYSESARSYELGKASDFACARPRPDFSAFLCLWRKVTIGWEMRPVRLVLQNIRNFFSQNEWCLPFTKIVGPVRAAIRRKVQVRKVREKPGGRLFTTFTDVLRPLTSLVKCNFPSPLIGIHGQPHWQLGVSGFTVHDSKAPVRLGFLNTGIVQYHVFSPYYTIKCSIILWKTIHKI